jgi:hypothetical protein
MKKNLLLLLCTTTFSAYALTKNEAALIQAAAKGDVKKVKTILKKFDKNKDKVDAFQEQQRVAGEEGYMIIPPGLSALQEATKGGHAEIVKALLDAGATVNDRCTLGLAEKDEVFDLLKKAGGEGGICGPEAYDHILNGKTGMIRKLLQSGLEAGFSESGGEFSTHNGTSLLLFAVDHSKTEIVELLIQRGADVNFAGTYGTPLAKAQEQLVFYTKEEGKTFSDAQSRIEAYKKIIQLLKAAGAK